MSSLAKAINLREIAVDNNPISLGGDCVSFLVSYLPHLTSLNTINITEQVRKAAMAWRRNKENSSTVFMDLTSDVSLNVKREEVISNARTNWELLRSQTKCLASNSSNAVNISKNLKPDNDFILTSLIKPNPKNNTRNKTNAVSNIGTVPVLPSKRLTIRTLSQETENSQNTSSSNTSSNEFFRLPPILLPIINKMEQKENCLKEGSVNLSASLSSLGPNIDSSVSSLPSNSDSSDSSYDLNDCSSENDYEEDEIEQPVPTIISNICMKPIDIPHENGFDTTNKNSEVTLTRTSTPCAKDSDISSSPSTKISSINLVSENDKTNLISTKKVRPVKSAALNQRVSQIKIRNRPVTSKSRKDVSSNDHSLDRDREQGGDYLIELCGRNLNIYGQGALRFIDKSWSITKAKDITKVNFNYVNFNSLTSIFNKLKHRFPNVENFVFQETNIQYLGQINALAEIQGLISLTINKEGNLITKKKWESYAIYRLSHWGLKFVNGREIFEDDIREANAEFQSLSDMVLWSLPDALLQPLLVRLQLNVNQKLNEQDAKKWLLSADPALKLVVVKEALQWKKGNLMQDDIILRQRAKTYLNSLLDEAFHAIYKLRRLDKEWPTMFREITSNILLDYTHLDLYMKRQLQELK